MKHDIAPRSRHIDFPAWWSRDTYSMGSTAIGPGIVFLYDIMKTSNDRAPNIEKSSSTSREEEGKTTKITQKTLDLRNRCHNKNRHGKTGSWSYMAEWRTSRCNQETINYKTFPDNLFNSIQFQEDSIGHSPYW